jgi:hypothetical protein
LPAPVSLEIVHEAGTNHHVRDAKHGRDIRHIESAVKIAGRKGYVYSRGKMIEQNN